MRESIIVLAIATPAVLLAVTLYWLDRVRRREAIFRWASRHGYRLIAFRQPILTEASPFPFSASKAQQVFKVQVKDGFGKLRSGWVRLGDAWRGLAADKADERWESD